MSLDNSSNLFLALQEEDPAFGCNRFRFECVGAWKCPWFLPELMQLTTRNPYREEHSSPGSPALKTRIARVVAARCFLLSSYLFTSATHTHLEASEPRICQPFRLRTEHFKPSWLCHPFRTVRQQVTSGKSLALILSKSICRVVGLKPPCRKFWTLDDSAAKIHIFGQTLAMWKPMSSQLSLLSQGPQRVNGLIELN